jgi:hypothetical protein
VRHATLARLANLTVEVFRDREDAEKMADRPYPVMVRLAERPVTSSLTARIAGAIVSP